MEVMGNSKLGSTCRYMHASTEVALVLWPASDRLFVFSHMYDHQTSSVPQSHSFAVYHGTVPCSLSNACVTHVAKIFGSTFDCREAGRPKYTHHPYVVPALFLFRLVEDASRIEIQYRVGPDVSHANSVVVACRYGMSTLSVSDHRPISRQTLLKHIIFIVYISL
jgi:hypothetical protein